MRQSVIDWWDGTMLTRGNSGTATGQVPAARVIVGQRIHERDLPGHLINEGDWELLCLPGEYEPKTARSTAILGFRDPRTKPGELLWPERFGPADFSQFKKMGSYRYAAQFQQSPAPAGGGLVKRSWWQYYDAASLPQDFDTIVQSWDLAFKDADTSDYVVGQVWAKKDGRFYLLDMVRDRLDFPATVRAFQAWAVKWESARAKYVEDKANGPAIIAQLKKSVPGLIAVEPKGSKEARVSAISPFIEAGNVFLPRNAAWLEDFLGEWTSFPKGEHDDTVDAGSQALDRMGGMGRKFNLLKYAELAGLGKVTS
jgi:predicted phage terminase large subunit-like protein